MKKKTNQVIDVNTDLGEIIRDSTNSWRKNWRAA